MDGLPDEWQGSVDGWCLPYDAPVIQKTSDDKDKASTRVWTKYKWTNLSSVVNWVVAHSSEVNMKFIVNNIGL